MTNSNKLNYTFKVRNIEATTARHAGQIKRLTNAGVRYSDIMGDPYLNDIIAYRLVDKNWYGFETWVKEPVKKAGRLTQEVLKHIKAEVNYYTRLFIQDQLQDSEKPKSWTTAFYAKYYDRVNREMVKTTKYIVSSYI